MYYVKIQFSIQTQKNALVNNQEVDKRHVFGEILLVLDISEEKILIFLKILIIAKNERYVRQIIEECVEKGQLGTFILCSHQYIIVMGGETAGQNNDSRFVDELNVKIGCIMNNLM